MLLFSSFIIVCIFANIAWSINNGLGRSPPMGWRSWNCYRSHINQSIIEKVIDAITDKRTVNGKPMSLLQIGYEQVGVDDNWQQCNKSGIHQHFHNDTAPNGWPVINHNFPNLTSLVQYGHSRNVKIGWYLNNCICSENYTYPANEKNDVEFLRMYDFDGIKFDGCGSSKNISNWEYLINISSSKPLLIENCHNEPDYANLTWCPMNMFRSSQDIDTYYPNVIGMNLKSVIPYNKYPGPSITRPGCFVYPDMLEIGNFPPQFNATPEAQDRSHFGAWIVVSAPLILGYDVTNNATTNRVWDVITNIEAINVSQTWYGHPGTLLAESDKDISYRQPPTASPTHPPVNISGWQIWGKPQFNNSWAVIILNCNGYGAETITLNFSIIPTFNNTKTAKIRSIWDKKDLGAFTNNYTAQNVPPFDSEFVMVSPI